MDVRARVGTLLVYVNVVDVDPLAPKSNTVAVEEVANVLIDPVTSEFPCERKPFFIMNSFGISFPYPRLC